MSTRQIGTLGTIDTLTIDGRVFTDLTTMIRLNAMIASNTKATFRKSNATSGYAVTALKTMTVMAVRVLSDNAANEADRMLYADNDLGNSSSGSFTNEVDVAGQTSMFISGTPTAATAPSRWDYGDVDFPVPAGKYLGWQLNGTRRYIKAFAYEA